MHACHVRTERDVDWVLNRVVLGERLVVQVGGLSRPGRHQLRGDVALCCLKARIEALGGQILPGDRTTAIGRLARGRSALLLPPETDGGDLGGVREPRRPTPNLPASRAALASVRLGA